MGQRVSLIALGVADVVRARRFYERLGWRGQEVQETVFFQAGGIGLVLWHQDKLAEDAGFDHGGSGGFPRGGGGGFRGVALAHKLGSGNDVGAVRAGARAAGASISRSPAATFYG